ncbi:hypothetical protein NE451_15025 [Bacteroides nordii]|uniref:ATP-grasp fold amidoligase family protein n=1 Tax=Bacteroides nordii TaxID=291645 RepID=UPI00210A7453|nr:ATP-grasp fold amidoligase family protein [Bacteroides nordii]MCQ4915804.1 hypothetical protein [Bacteroides nordii]
MKIILRKIFPFIIPLSWKWHEYIYNKDPKVAANRIYKKVFGKDINWMCPLDLVEINFWMRFYTDTTKWTELSDKYRVREYITNCGFEGMLSKLYGVYQTAQEIDFEVLPKSFVLKTNNACGTVILVKDKSKLDINKTRKILDLWLTFPYGVMNVEPHYLDIKPCIVAEEFLEDLSGVSTSLIDYKFFCFYGEPDCIEVIYDRSITDHTFSKDIYDMEWNYRPELLRKKFRNRSKLISKPHSFDDMIAACRVLAKQFPFVRMDFYEINGKPYFGEMTFTPGIDNFTPEQYKIFGKKIDINSINSK